MYVFRYTHMKHILKKYFIPHEENNYHPHILHTKRTFFYSSLFIGMKMIVVLTVIFLPMSAFTSSDALLGQQQHIIDLTNNIRERKGLTPINRASKLTTSAQYKSNDMAEGQYFAHTAPDGKNLRYFLNYVAYDFSYAGENLAMGFATAGDVVDAWIKSPTHYANLIDPDFQEIGIGVAAGSFDNIPTTYVTQHFGKPRVLAQAQTAQQPTEIIPEKPQETVLAEQIKPQQSTPEEIPSQTPTTNPPVQNFQPSEVQMDTKSDTKTPAENPIEERDVKPLPTPVSEEANQEVHAAMTETQVQTVIDQIIYNKDASEVYWQDTADGKTTISARVSVEGPVDTVSIFVDGKVILLAPSEVENVYIGGTVLDISSDELFHVILDPSLLIVAGDTHIQDTVHWDNAKLVIPGTFKKYSFVKENMHDLDTLMYTLRAIYVFFIAFLSIALLLKIFIEIKKQHPHVIMQTLGLLCLLVLLMVV